MNNLLLILAMMVLSNGSIPLFDNKNKSSKPAENSERRESVETSSRSSQGNKSVQKVRKIKKVKKKTKSIGSGKGILNFDMTDVNKGIKLLDLSEDDLDRGMEIITRTKKYMNKEERNVLIKLESVLDLVKGIKKLNDINILSEEDESEFFRSMDDEDKKNMMIKEILEVFPEKKKQSVEKALEMKKMIDLFAELFLPDGKEDGGFSLSSLADINNLGSIGNLKLLGNLLRSLDDEGYEEDDDKDYEYVEIDDDTEEDNEVEDDIESYNEYLEESMPVSNTNTSQNSKKTKKTRTRRTKTRKKKNSTNK
ncbi:hypothetical protein [Terrisporobacter sp.]|uniref:hypothetical protein n=1 Tax=Terrisporobacter sp. TaxID=1965305 RepID=UPI0026081549|nr:hypothetical protein [Terrisporobacter sp.]